MNAFFRCSRTAPLTTLILILSLPLVHGCKPNASPGDTAGAGGTAGDPGEPAPHLSRRKLKYTIPDGLDGQGLLDFINDLANQPTVGETSEERARDLGHIMDARCVAAEMILAGDDAEMLGNTAAQIKLESLRVLSNIGQPESAERLLDYARELSRSEDAELARYGRLGIFHSDVDEVLNPEGTPEATVLRVEKFLAEETDRDRLVLDASAEAMELLAALEYHEQAVRIADAIETQFAESTDPGVPTALADVVARANELRLGILFVEWMEGNRKIESRLLETSQELLASQPDPRDLRRILTYAQQIEQQGKLDLASKLLDQLRAAIEETDDHDELIDSVGDRLQRARKRIQLIGQPIEIIGQTMDGETIRLEDYAGKLVILDFWATWCQPCIAEIENLRELYEREHENGLEIIGINVDRQEIVVREFLEKNPLPWPNIVEFHPSGTAVDEHPGSTASDDLPNTPQFNPVAEACGVETIPFIVLVAPDGNVVGIHLKGDRLAGEIALRISDTFQPESRPDKPDSENPTEETAPEGADSEENGAEEAPEEESPEEESPEEESPEEEAPEEESPEEEAPEEKSPEEEAPEEEAPEDISVEPVSETSDHAGRYVRWVAQATRAPSDELEDASDSPVTETAHAPDRDQPTGATPQQATRKDRSAPAGATDDKALQSPTSGNNPYAPPENFTIQELTLFLLDMQDKTRSIQYRPGFREAIVIAADRVLDASPDAKPGQLREAINAKFHYLHRDARLGDPSAQEQIDAATDALASHDVPVAEVWRTFLLKEQEVLQATANDGPAREELVKELTDYLADQKEELDSRHLRMASAIVDLINRSQPDRREDQFQALASALQASKVAELKRYGRQIAGSPGSSPADWVGKPIELTGSTLDDEVFDPKWIQGKVVIVDFWATWCGPCRKAIPELQQLYADNQSEGLEIVSISLDRDIDALANFLDGNELPWIHLVGEQSAEMATRLGVRGIPSMFLVDRQGKILAQAHHAGQFLDQMKAALAEPDPPEKPSRDAAR